MRRVHGRYITKMRKWRMASGNPGILASGLVGKQVERWKLSSYRTSERRGVNVVIA